MQHNSVTLLSISPEALVVPAVAPWLERQTESSVSLLHGTGHRPPASQHYSSDSISIVYTLKKHCCYKANYNVCQQELVSISPQYTPCGLGCKGQGSYLCQTGSHTIQQALKGVQQGQ